MIVFAPLVVIFSIFYILFGILPQHIRENGFHNFFPRKKGKHILYQSLSHIIYPKTSYAMERKILGQSTNLTGNI